MVTGAFMFTGPLLDRLAVGATLFTVTTCGARAVVPAPFGAGGGVGCRAVCGLGGGGGKRAATVRPPAPHVAVAGEVPAPAAGRPGEGDARRLISRLVGPGVRDGGA